MSGTRDTNENEPDNPESNDDFDPGEYNTLVELERLESLEEEMQELGVTSLEDIRRRIEEMNAQLDEERKG